MAKFFRGPYASYVQATHGEGIYFAIDKGIIKMNGRDYIGPLADSTAVKNIALNADGDKFVVTYLDGTTGEIEAASSEYESGIEDKTLAMPNAVGGIAKGTKISALEGKSFSAMFDDLLFPSVNPSHGNPSLTGFALSPSTTPVELGTTVASISEAGLNKATWTTYNNNLAYAGDITSTSYEITINGTKYTSRTGLPSAYTTLGSQTYKATVNYAAGPTPVNNKGAEVPSLAAPAGSVSATRTVNVTCPWYASTVTAGTLTKQGLVSWNATAGAMSSGEFTVQPHTVSAPQTFKLPRAASSLQMYNTVAGKYETVALSDWTMTSASESVNGVSHTYYTYAYKGDARGSVKLIVKF